MKNCLLTIVFLCLSIFQSIAEARGTKNWIGRRFPKDDKFSWQGCPDAKPSDFKQTKVVDFSRHKVRQPLAVIFNKTSDVPNFYFIEKITGKVRYYVDATGEVQEVGEISELHTGGTEDGLNGLALDYDFDKTRWMYLFYSVKGYFRVARFKVSADNKLQYDTKQVILDAPKNDGKWHASGKMDFDVYGNLYISIGDNLLGYKGDKTYISMATADLRGSWLRIHPTEQPQANGKYYTIPKDNFGEYWAKQFEKQGKADLASQYRDPKMVLPEIFSKGVRNSWGLKVVQPFTPVVASGECGPDHPKPDGFTEQTNLVSKPAFHGWPLHMGIKDWTFYKGGQISSMPGGTEYDSLAPKIIDNDKIKGVRELPPIQTSVYHWEYRKNAPSEKTRSCGTGAAVYWYDGYSQSKRKFPPHFNGALFATDHDAQWIRIVKLNKTLDKVISESEFFNPNTSIQYPKPVDVTFGPDGALYVVHFVGAWFKDNAGHHISRIEYTGNCHPDEPKSPFRHCTQGPNAHPIAKHPCPGNACCGTSAVKPPEAKTLFDISNGKSRLSVSITNSNRHSLQVLDINGKLMDSRRGEGARSYHFSNLKPGLYLIKLKVDNWEYARKVLAYF